MIICPFCSKPITVNVDPDSDVAEGKCEENFMVPGYTYPVGCFVQTDPSNTEVITGYQLNLFFNREMTAQTQMYGFDSFMSESSSPPVTRLYYLYEDDDDHDIVLASPKLVMDIDLWTPIEQALSTFQRLLKLKAFL